MTATVSYHWLLAEAVAWPLTSEESFNAAITAFERQRFGVFAKGTDRLAQTLEDRLRPLSRGLSLDAIRQLTVRAWFGDGGGEATHTPADFLARIAADHLHHDGASVRLRVDGDASELAGRWRWMSLVLPSDTLVAALSSNEARPPVTHVHLAPYLLATRLRESPVAEGHLHVGAAVSFDMLWSSLATVIGSPGFAGDQLQTSGRPPFGSNRAMSQRLLEAFIVRLLLAAFLHARRSGFDRGFASWSLQAYPAIARSLGWARGSIDAEIRLAQVAHSLAAPAPSMNWPELRLLYRKLTGPVRPRPKRYDDAFDRDPLRHLFANGSPESALQYDALGYIGCGTRAGEGKGDRAFQRLFWQYLRVRNITYRQVVEQPGTSGLDWFGRHYYRISPLRAGLESTLFRRAFEVEARGLNLGAIEVRTSPARQWSELLRMLRDIASQARTFGDAAERGGQQRPEVGLVLHFIKGLTRGHGANATMHADPRTHVYGCRYGEWFHNRWREVISIERVLRYHPDMLVLLRGIDVANTELAIPTWTVLPLLRMVHAASHRAASLLAHRRSEWKVAPMRTTVHAGEEYRSLLEGIRHVHELVEFGGITNGDRIGHGIALGEQAPRWRWRVGGTITQPREERLDDILWLLDRFAFRDLSDTRAASAGLQREAREHAATIYDRTNLSIDRLLDARRRRHNAADLSALRYPFMTSRAKRDDVNDPAGALLERYLTDPDVFVRGQQPIPVEFGDDDVTLIDAAQQAVRRKLAKMQVTLESNPSSNLLIGELIDLEQHPAFRLQPLKATQSDEKLLLSINTDNPLTFSTSLADEYAYIYYALLQHPGVTSGDALTWLDQRRTDGWLSRFTLLASTKTAVLDELAAVLRA